MGNPGVLFNRLPKPNVLRILLFYNYSCCLVTYIMLNNSTIYAKFIFKFSITHNNLLGINRTQNFKAKYD